MVIGVFVLLELLARVRSEAVVLTILAFVFATIVVGIVLGIHKWWRE